MCLTNGNNLCLGTSAKKLVALPTATWEAMSEVINTGKDGNSLLRPGCNPPNCFFPNAIPLGEMIEKNAPHPSLKRGIRADFRRIVASWSSRRIPIGCSPPGSLLREIKLAQVRECASFTRLFFFLRTNSDEIRSSRSSLLVVAGRKGNDPGERGGIALEKSIKNSSALRVTLFFQASIEGG